MSPATHCGSTAYGKPGALTATNSIPIAPGTFALRGYVLAKTAETVPHTPAGRGPDAGPRGSVVGGEPSPPPPAARPARARAASQGESASGMQKPVAEVIDVDACPEAAPPRGPLSPAALRARNVVPRHP